MKTNLFPRFLIILIVGFIASWIAITKEPYKGIDLAGGTSLLYELDLDKIPGTNKETRLEMAQQVVEVLQKRVDPRGEKNISWRVMEQGRRIQIQMPFPPKAVIAAKEREDAAFRELQSTGWKESTLVPALQKAGPERDAALQQFAGKDADAYKVLQDLAGAWDKLVEANARLAAGGGESQEKLLSDRLAAQQEYDGKLDLAISQTIEPTKVRTLVTEADELENEKQREAIPKLGEKYPLQKEKIEAYYKAHLDLMGLNGGGVNDSNELKRLVTKAGVLDFRIAVRPTEISSSQLEDARKSLLQKGPEQAVDVGSTKGRWFGIKKEGEEGLLTRDYVTIETPEGESFLLCYDDHDRMITHSDPKRAPWSVKAGTPDSDIDGISLPFTLDPVGAGYMGDMTRAWKGHPMAILLDDKTMNAPTIQSVINDSGRITFGKAGPNRTLTSIRKEAEQLKTIMDAGSLPATLRSEPISEENISSDMGADNIDAGIRSALIAVIAVMGFMILYYTITGAFANLALMLNLALVMATMWVLQQRFTLPGIAGLVLTLGMAVDANVLINERIREEIHRGASLWMAIKQGYDKVFWTIFDANLTTSLTSIVLIFVGSAEVKGFGVTLLIGLCIHMFTALFVTRTLMAAAAQWGILKAIDDHSLAEYVKEIGTFTWLRNGHWPFMRVITVTNIDWIGKRHWFWGISAVITVAGLVAFIVRGDEKYDIEFRGGTQVTMQLKAAAGGEEFLSVDQVRNRIEEMSTKPGLHELGTARVYTVGKPELHRVQMQTTLANKKQDFDKTLLAPLTAKLGAAVDPSSIKINVESDGTKVTFTQLVRPAGFMTPDDVKKIFAEMAAAPGAPQGFEDLALADPKVAGTPEKMEVNIPNQGIRRLLLEPLAEAFKDVLDYKPKLAIKVGTAVEGVDKIDIKELRTRGYLVPISSNRTSVSLHDVFFSTPAFPDMPPWDVTAYKGGAAIVLDEISSSNPITVEKLTERITAMRRGAEFSSNRPFVILPVTVLDADGKAVAAEENDKRPLKRAVVVTADPSYPYNADSDKKLADWETKVAANEWQIINRTLADQSLFEGVTTFDSVVAGQAKFQALAAIVISLVLIVIYVWVRFGGFRYGVGAILSLMHDAIVALAATVLSGVVINKFFGGHPFLLISDFKINLTMIAAYLTVIGYSVNDTIVIFDRVRELRGKSMLPLSKKLINDAINQCFGRTIWTTFTVFIVVLIMYIWGGEGVRGFSFAMLVGVLTGAYSTLAIASPMLLTTGAGGSTALQGPNPFQRKETADAT